MPFTVHGVGRSGSRSMAENLKARPQVLNEETFDGDSEVGSGSGAMGRNATPLL